MHSTFVDFVNVRKEEHLKTAIEHFDLCTIQTRADVLYLSYFFA